MTFKSALILFIAVLSGLLCGCSTPLPGDAQMYPAIPNQTSNLAFPAGHPANRVDPSMHAGY